MGIMYKITLLVSLLLSVSAHAALGLSPGVPYDRPIAEWPVNPIITGDGGDWVLIQTLTRPPTSQRAWLEMIFEPATSLKGQGEYMGSIVDCKRYMPNNGLDCDGFIFPNAIAGLPDIALIKTFIAQWRVGKPAKLFPYYNTAARTECLVTLTFSSYRYSSLLHSPCDSSVKEPVSCTLSGDEVLDHGHHFIGDSASIARGTWEISCSASTSVVVNTQKDITLANANGKELDSGLYIGTSGFTEGRLQVDRTSQVSILSEVPGPMSEAGSFTGSGIIRITWD